MADCSFGTSFSGLVTNWLIAGRDEEINGCYHTHEQMAKIRPNECLDDTCTGFLTGVTKFSIGIGFALLLVANIVEIIAKFTFAAITLPISLFEEGRSFYRNVSMAGLLNAIYSLATISHAFFANVYETRIQSAFLATRH